MFNFNSVIIELFVVIDIFIRIIFLIFAKQDK